MGALLCSGVWGQPPWESLAHVPAIWSFTELQDPGHTGPPASLTPHNCTPGCRQGGWDPGTVGAEGRGWRTPPISEGKGRRWEKTSPDSGGCSGSGSHSGGSELGPGMCVIHVSTCMCVTHVSILLLHGKGWEVVRREAGQRVEQGLGGPGSQGHTGARKPSGRASQGTWLGQKSWGFRRGRKTMRSRRG